LDDGNVLISPTALVESKRPELLHCWCAGAPSLELANSF
jgi:hypothetical protein